MLGVCAPKNTERRCVVAKRARHPLCKEPIVQIRKVSVLRAHTRTVGVGHDTQQLVPVAEMRRAHASRLIDSHRDGFGRLVCSCTSAGQDLPADDGQEREELRRMRRRLLHVHEADLDCAVTRVDAHAPPAGAGILVETTVSGERLEVFDTLDIGWHEIGLDGHIHVHPLARIAVPDTHVLGRAGRESDERRDERAQTVQKPNRFGKRPTSVVPMQARDPAGSKTLLGNATLDLEIPRLWIDLGIKREARRRVGIDIKLVEFTQMLKVRARCDEIALDLTRVAADACDSLDLNRRKFRLQEAVRDILVEQPRSDGFVCCTALVRRPVLDFRSEATCVNRTEHALLIETHGASFLFRTLLVTKNISLLIHTPARYTDKKTKLLDSSRSDRQFVPNKLNSNYTDKIDSARYIL